MVDEYRIRDHRGHARRSTGRRFLRNDSGSATVEFVLWVPLFAVFLIMVADFTLMLMNHANIWDITRDGARRVAFHELSADEAKEYIATRLSGLSERVEIEASDGDEVVITVHTPVSDVTPFGLYAYTPSGWISTQVTMLKEPI